jgi:hypothetical protein
VYSSNVAPSSSSPRRLISSKIFMTHLSVIHDSSFCD